jgi:nickel-dependent lactate racemase
VKALKNPINSVPIDRMAKKGKRVVVIVDDLTRLTPQKNILPTILEFLCSNRVEEDNVEIMIGLGSHRAMTKAEITDRVGPEVAERFTVSQHDCLDEKGLVNLGTTTLGIPALVNKTVADADLVLAVGNIVPHNAAGWAGGTKMILPAVSGAKSIGTLHTEAGKIKPISKLVATLDNPIRHCMNEIARKAGLKAVVNTVLNHDDEVSGLFVGDPVRAHRAGVAAASEVFCQEVDDLADVVICSSYPADIDYWQAGKALDYASLGVRRGGTIILITPCPERISPAHSGLTSRATESYSSLLGAVERGEIENPSVAGFLLMHSQLLEHANVICYSRGLTGEDMRGLGFTNASTIEEAIQMALKRHGERARIGVLECGEVVPIAPRSRL